MKRLLALSAVALATACSTPTPPAPEPAASAASSAAAAPDAAKLDALPRLDFNRIAAELDLPLFWIADAKHPGVLDPDELAVLWGVAPAGPAWIEGGKFSKAFLDAYAAMVKWRSEGPKGGDAADKKRRAAVLAELAQGRPSLVRSDFKAASAEDKAIVAHVLEAAKTIEVLYAKQLGVLGMDREIPSDDPSSRMLFYRNHGPRCHAPKTESDPDCSALPSKPARRSGLYPAALQGDPKFCEALEKRPDQKGLLGPFTVVVESKPDDAVSPLKAVAYSAAYKDEMTAVSRELRAAADAVESPGEAVFKAYLLAASQAFLDDGWERADEAWAKMSVDNSKWYLRVAPDEVYEDTCSHKAGFQVSFARINQDSVTWQKKLAPVQNDMEEALAKLAGAPYKARKVTFHLPDFIDVVLNAGDARSPSGATIGESLPNWGPVANEGRGRTVAMTNFYTDPDSLAASKERLASLYCKPTFDAVSYEPSLSTMSTVLHEASHNLGPAHEYKVSGKTDTEVFGGPLASTLEELKAQTSALYFVDWLVERSLLDKKTAEASHLADIAWALGHVAEGVYEADGKPKPYSQLAAIQVGALLATGAMTWNAGEMAPNGKDKGCFALQMDKFAPAIAALAKDVLGIKARGDKDGATKLREEHVDKEGEWKRLRGVIQERWLRTPKPSFVYAIEL